MGWPGAWLWRVLLVVLGRSVLSGITPATLALFGGWRWFRLPPARCTRSVTAAAVDLRTGSVIQFTAAGVVLLPLALVFRNHARCAGAASSFARWPGWCWCCRSAAISLLYVLIRKGAATKVASFFYLVPPTTALMAYAMFGETLSSVAMAGMALAAIGVALVVYRRQ